MLAKTAQGILRGVLPPLIHFLPKAIHESVIDCRKESKIFSRKGVVALQMNS